MLKYIEIESKLNIAYICLSFEFRCWWNEGLTWRNRCRWRIRRRGRCKSTSKCSRPRNRSKVSTTCHPRISPSGFRLLLALCACVSFRSASTCGNLGTRREHWTSVKFPALLLRFVRRIWRFSKYRSIKFATEKLKCSEELITMTRVIFLEIQVSRNTLLCKYMNFL